MAEFAQGKIKASECPIAFYTEGEPFQNEYPNGQTFEAALRQYWAGGGVVVFASWQPWPLYRNLDTGETGWSKKIGLTLANGDQGEGKRGFESRPEEGLVFRDTKAGAEEPFPTQGEQRFRPSFAPDGAEGLEYQAWLTVFGPSGRRYGDALSRYHYRSGPCTPAKMIYAWTGLWNTGDPTKRCQDILEKAREFAAES